MDIVSIKKFDVIISNAADDYVIGSFTASQLNTNFTLSGIPTCTALLTSGTSLGSKSDNASDIRQLISTYNTVGVRMKVLAQIVALTSSGSSFSSSGVIDVQVFDGVVVNVSTNTRIAPYGNSYDGVAVTAYHKFADLYKIGSGGMVYKSPSAIRRYQSLSSIIRSQTAHDKDDENNTNNLQPAVVHRVLKSCITPKGSGSGSNKNKPIAYAIKTLVDEMYKGNILDKPVVDVSKYVTGTAAMDNNLSSYDITEAFTKNYLNQIWYGVSKNSVGSAILTMLTDKEHLLTMAPRSVDAITIIPDDGITIHKDHPVITTGMYNSINYTTPNSVHPSPDGVLVTMQGSDHMFGGSAGHGVIIGSFPKLSKGLSTNNIRWMYTRAPLWLTDTSSIMYNRNNENSSQSHEADYADICDRYAEWMYKSHIHRDNTLSLSTDARFIEAYKALGAVCEINTESCGALKGRFFSYNLNYTQTAQQSSLSVNLYFSHVEEYSEESIHESKSGGTLYVVNDSDNIKEIPSIIEQGTVTSEYSK